MVLLDVSIVTVALPSIEQGLSASSSDVQWVSSGYALAFGLVLVAAGRLGDVRGRKPVFIAGLALFTLSSALCGLAPVPVLLVVARLVQGLAGGLLQPQVSGFIQELFRGPERGRAFGLFGAMVGLSTALGPLIGGSLIGLFGAQQGWRAVFFVNVPIGLVAVPLAMKLLPPAPGGHRSAGLDPVGTVMLGTGVLAVLFPTVEARASGHAALWLLVIPGLALLTGFIGWERFWSRSGHDPMVDLQLFRQRSYIHGVCLGTLYFGGFTAIFFVLALFLQEGHHYSALQSGLCVTPFALGSGVSALISGRLVSWAGRRLTVAGLLLVILGMGVTDGVIRLASTDAIGLLIAAPLLVAGLGSGAVISPNLTLTLSEVPVQEGGTAGAVLQTGQRIGSAAGIAAVGSLLFWRLSSTRGDWGAAVSIALLLTISLVGAALVLAVADVISEHGGRNREQDHKTMSASRST